MTRTFRHRLATVLTDYGSRPRPNSVPLACAMACFLICVAPASAAEPDPDGIAFFESRIRPVFVEHCQQCHSEEASKLSKLKGGLRLDSSAGIRNGGDSGPMFVIGKPAESALIKALRHDELKMPPDARLPDAIIANFEHWIMIGAPTPADSGRPTTTKEINWTEARTAWAFQTPVEHPRPVLQNGNWAKSVIDGFVLEQLEKRGLSPVKPAEKRELIRRATIDLIGLPPTPEEIQQFLADESPEAFAHVIDRLLKSPHYGERWARYWLDLARYADDQGNSFLSPTPKAYLYRDWVVRALNRDLPYDEFIRLQLAGDELPGAADDYTDRLAGLGFQGLGPQFRKGAAGEAKAKADELEDRVDTMSRGLLGLTISCARCHDHKFDPIPTRDYYSVAAAYNGAAWSDRMLASPEAIARHQQWQQQLQTQKSDLEKWTAEQGRSIGHRALAKLDIYLTTAWRGRAARALKLPFDEAAIAKRENLEPYFLGRFLKFLETAKDVESVDAWRRIADQTPSAETVPDPLLQQNQAFKAAVNLALGKHDSNTPLAPVEQALLKVLWQDGAAPFFVEPKSIVGMLGPDAREEHATRQKNIDQLAAASPPAGPMMPSVSGGGEPLRIFIRGNPLQLGEPARPGFLRILGGVDQGESARFTRLDLANAIASPQNPLTARVLVNRVWHYHFGRGIVSTLGNFGKQGAAPTHPDLLDTLAVRFMKSNWSIKSLHREIMLSSTYQLSGAHNPVNESKDPDNHYLWRMSPRRLDVEAWRDTLLSVAGRLDPTIGGPALDQTTPAVKEVPGADFYTRLVGLQLDDPSNGRRTLYCIVSRYAPNSTAGLFDFPEPNVASDLRNVTTIPQQQLFVLNSAFMMEMAKAFGQRLTKAAPDDESRLRLGWELAYGRPPTTTELSLALEFLRDKGTDDGNDSLGRLEQLCHALLSSNEFVFLP